MEVEGYDCREVKVTAAARSLTIRLEGPAVREGRVSVRLLTRTLGAFQKAAYDLGNARLSRDPVTGGRLPASIERECELFLTRMDRTSLTAVLELPPQESSLFPELVELGEQVLADMKGVLESILEDSPGRLQDLIPDPGHRKKVLREVLLALPPQSSDYSLSVGFGSHPALRPISRPPEEQLQRLMDLPPGMRPAAGPVLVQGTCIATLVKEGPPKVLDWLEYVIVDEDTRPHRIARVEWGGRVFMLAHEIACAVAREGPFIVLTYEPLGVRTYGASRQDVIRDFNEEFAFLWDEYALEDGENLTSDARDLKQSLLKLVEEVAPR